MLHTAKSDIENLIHIHRLAAILQTQNCIVPEQVAYGAKAHEQYNIIMNYQELINIANSTSKLCCIVFITHYNNLNKSDVNSVLVVTY